LDENVVRGLPRLDRVAPTVVVLVDHASQPAQVHRLRVSRPSPATPLGVVGVIFALVWVGLLLMRRDVALANLGTLVGAVSFLIGALLLVPERTEDIQRGTVSDHNDTRKRDGP
jgi:hypothetical protein